jgi:sulfite exporter TauE/SafE
MPLSEHEQRMLDEIERALYEEDPKFATSVDVTRMRRRRPIAAAALFVVGLVCLVVGVIATQNVLALGVVVSVVGFLVMVAGVGLFVFGIPGRGRNTATTVTPKTPRPANSLSERMEERLRRRFDQEG